LAFTSGVKHRNSSVSTVGYIYRRRCDSNPNGLVELAGKVAKAAKGKEKAPIRLVDLNARASVINNINPVQNRAGGDAMRTQEEAFIGAEASETKGDIAAW
jgi:hypothetical protein